MLKEAETELKPRVFVASSKEGGDIARNLQLELGSEIETTLWSQGIFSLSRSFLESLWEMSHRIDYAVLVLTPDDRRIRRDIDTMVPRDNVILELGLCMGVLGPDRTFLVCPEDLPLELPSDLQGLSVARFPVRRDGNLRAALGAACTLIRNRVLGSRTRTRADFVPRRRRRRSLGLACTAGPRHEHRIVDISVTGALLETGGRIPVGQALNLELRLEDGSSVRVEARVIRVQEPDWGRIGGVGVAFTEIHPADRQALERYVEAESLLPA